MYDNWNKCIFWIGATAEQSANNFQQLIFWEIAQFIGLAECGVPHHPVATCDMGNQYSQVILHHLSLMYVPGKNFTMADISSTGVEVLCQWWQTQSRGGMFVRAVIQQSTSNCATTWGDSLRSRRWWNMSVTQGILWKRMASGPKTLFPSGTKLTCQDDLLVRGNRIVILTSLVFIFWRRSTVGLRLILRTIGSSCTLAYF